MLKKLIILIMVVTHFKANSQVLINLQLPPLGLTVKQQLWNLSLINLGTGSINVKIDLIMTEATTNQQVMTAVTNTFSLPAGVKQISINDVSPISYNVTGVGYNIDASPNGFLPIGTFNFCYVITRINTDAPERMGEECETIEIEPLSPPQLVSPGDSERVELTRPLFTWLPPGPYNLFSSLNYDWVLTEVLSMQTGAEAIQQNIPVLSQSNLLQTNFQYPLAMPELDTSKTYAWRITAKNNSSVIANSEIWTFRVRKFGQDTVTFKNTGNYTKLRTENDASYVICTGILFYEYLNELNSNSVSIKIFEIGIPVKQEMSLSTSVFSMSYGQNFVDLDLREYSWLKDKHIYLLELSDRKDQKSYLKFEYRKQD